MATIAFGAARSCGVTTLALAAMSVWPPDRTVLLAELDPAGGTLCARLGLPAEPGVVSLAAAARRNLDAEAVWSQAQPLGEHRSILVGPPSARQASSALGYLTGLWPILPELGADVLVDCGRIDHRSRPVEGARRVLCARPELADLTHLADLLEGGTNAGPTEVVLIGAGSYSPGEVSDALGVPVTALVPWDPPAASQIDGRSPGRALSRAPLVRATRGLVDGLRDRCEADRAGRQVGGLPPPPVPAPDERVEARP